MIRVKSKPGEHVDSLVRRFKRAVQKEGLMNDMRRVAHYQKPSEKRRAKLKKSAGRMLSAR
jgi:small subunit ribosomal protein S21